MRPRNKYISSTIHNLLALKNKQEDTYLNIYNLQ